jgi:hypothetical protein
MQARGNAAADSSVGNSLGAVAMENNKLKPKAFPAGEMERASIRALKNWLLAVPGESPFAEQIVRLRIAAAIAAVSSADPDRRSVKD